MKLAFLSDIHANLPALEAVLAAIDARDPDMIFCLGDLVGYAPWPNEVVESIRSRRIPTIAGNYDEGVGLSSDDCGCAYKTPEDEARGVESISFTNGVISDANRIYLRDLPRHIRISVGAPRNLAATTTEFLLVHGSPRRINEYLFEDRADASFVRMMQTAGADVMLFGHTHKPYHKRLMDNGDGGRILHAINIGSVGKPKDGDPRACFALVEISHSTDASCILEVEFVRVAYDVEKAARAIEASPLPDEFADMLRKAY